MQPWHWTAATKASDVTGWGEALGDEQHGWRRHCTVVLLCLRARMLSVHLLQTSYPSSQQSMVMRDACLCN